MLQAKLRILILGGAIALMCGASATPCKAGPVIDWLTGQPGVYAYPYGYGYPAYTTAYRPAYTTAYRPLWSPWAKRTVVGYAPSTTYRTRWARVPVTTYRPATSVDPASGLAVTCMRPCTSYRWQLQRVPYTTYRRVYAPLQCSTGCATSACSNGCSTVGCNSCGVTAATATPASPYYPSPGPASAAPANAVPADVSPKLDPSNLQGMNLQKVTPLSSNTTRASSVPVQPKRQPARSFNLRLIPDPDAPKKTNAAPQLLNPRDRSASRSHVIRASTTTPRQKKPWDDSGWTSARP